MNKNTLAGISTVIVLAAGFGVGTAVHPGVPAVHTVTRTVTVTKVHEVKVPVVKTVTKTVIKTVKVPTPQPNVKPTPPKPVVASKPSAQSSYVAQRAAAGDTNCPTYNPDVIDDNCPQQAAPQPVAPAPSGPTYSAQCYALYHGDPDANGNNTYYQYAPNGHCVTASGGE